MMKTMTTAVWVVDVKGIEAGSINNDAGGRFHVSKGVLEATFWRTVLSVTTMF